MADDYNFQKELKDSIFNSDPKLDKKELLVDIFKSYVAKLFEITMVKYGSDKKGRLPVSALVEVKRNLISEFRNAELSEYQMSVKQYEELFDKTVKEIVDFAGSRHGGVDNTTVNSTLDINVSGYKEVRSEGGIILPS